VRGAAVPDIGAAHDSDQTVAPIVLADGPTWRDHPSRPTPAITVFLRTPGCAAGAGDAQAGDREHGSDIVIDYHDPLWPVIRRVTPGFEHSADELYVSETRAFFANRALRWNDKFGDDLPAYEQAIRESHVPSGGTVVDVGCGTGRALPAIRRAVGDSGVVIGVDLTAEMLAVASVQCNGQFQLLMADARRLPLSSGSVDVVFAAGLLQHLPDPAIGFQELGRITRPGGRLIIFHPSGRAALAARHGRTLRGDETLAAEQLEQLLCGNGWRLTRYDDPPHRFYALAERTASQLS
jgi:SAM-dependent methyltransferase